MSEPLENLRAAYQILKGNTQLSFQVDEALQFFAAAQLHQDIIPPTEFAVLETSIDTMVTTLNEARHQSSDPPTSSPLTVTTHSSTGGRPHVDIDPTFLSHALTLRGPTGLRPVFSVSSRTIQRRALEYGLVQPGEPIYTDTPQPNGTVSRTYTSTSVPVSPISDEDLDFIVSAILRTFPNFGRRMLKGWLRAAGYHIPRDRLAASYLCLIHFKIVIHCFIDGKSCYVTGIRVSNNNRAETVLNLFHTAVTSYGLPSHV
ncbi:hypothetical protein C8F04DRAFT_1210129 [Mycena alexandri]|uniref:Integrase core domain-containing protein n=1 Tax=Mycena alexandri TaxID=1745969 RepID=A0AAD6X5Z2_9AGAR|nr:hypothetical protein C8F04DRAFT_1210129 [Mycena alexandri]